jgi:radical SAM superfamily enzyme YgiQ (UPF0313 family)
MILAANTPPGFEVRIADEAAGPVPFDEPWDLVGISSITATAPRAWAIAAEFRRRRVPVILGGIHASFRPDEAAEHADSVFVGEADDGWAEVLDDAASGRGLKPRYEAKDHPELAGRPFPRRDLLAKGVYGAATVMASRGCPHGCSFCSTTRFLGRKLRLRPPAEVAAEAASLPGRILVFTDDNLFADKEWALSLLEAVAPLRKRWVAQCSFEASRRPDLLAAARRAGCMGVLIGFESLSAENLRDVRKGVNKAEDYLSGVQAFRDHGLLVQGSFIFGLDGDTRETFRETLDFVFRAKLGAANFAVLTPLPGTEVFRRLEEEGRIATTDWSLYDKLNVVFRPKHLTPEDLREGVKAAYREVFSLRGIWRRVPLLHRNGILCWLYNLNYRRGVMKGWD